MCQCFIILSDIGHKGTIIIYLISTNTKLFIFYCDLSLVFNCDLQIVSIYVKLFVNALVLKQNYYLCTRKPIIQFMPKSDLRIKELCRTKNITQAQLAQTLGIRPDSFSQAIARNNFDMDYLKRIAAALDVSVASLFEQKPTFTCPHCGKEISIRIG